MSEEIEEVDGCDDIMRNGDLCVIIRQPIEVFGVDNYHELEKELDLALNPVGYTRIGSDKLKTQIYIHYKLEERNIFKRVLEEGE